MNKNCHGVYIRGTYPELADSVIPQYLTYFPPQEHQYSYNKSERVCDYINGTRLDFRAFDRDMKILSNEYDFVAFSQIEELPKELFLQTLGRNRRKVGGIPKNIILAEGNPASSWLKTRLKDNPLKPEMFLIEAKTSDNPFLPPEYEKTLRSNYPEYWIARYIDGEWTSIDEAVFSEFREWRDVRDVMPYSLIKPFKQRIGGDYGWINPTALVWGYVDYDGNVTIFDEWGGERQTIKDIGLNAQRYGKLTVVMDYSIKGTRKDGRSIWQDLEAEGLLLIESNKQELENIVLVNSLFKQGRLKITRNCVNLLNEIRNYKLKKLKLGQERNRFEEPIDKDNHYIDAMLYLLASLEEIKTPNPKDEQYKQTLEYHNIQQPKKLQGAKYS